jgi:SNF2 family DNA or RNA helicase
MVFNDLSWKAHENEQAEKRIHRIGQDKMVTIHRIIKGSVDARIVDILTRKMKEIGDCT